MLTLEKPTRRRWRLDVVARIMSLICVLTPTVVSGQDEAPKSHALVIGINSYIADIEGVPELEFARHDADDITKYLETIGGWDVHTLTNTNATRELIVGELARLARVAKPQDSVLIFFAGHGVRNKTSANMTYWLTDGTLVF